MLQLVLLKWAGMAKEEKSVGWTKEHAQLLRIFGVQHLVVAVNRMDVVAYAKERFDFIKRQLGGFQSLPIFVVTKKALASTCTLAI
jgi:translation elongation factor EF-1alpha